MIFNFIIAILKSVIKNSPNILLIKNTKKWENKIANYKEEVQFKFYFTMLEILPGEKEELWNYYLLY
jgi:hypothetical protein